MEALEVSGYTEQEKIQIALQHLVPTLRKSFHLKTAQLGFTAPVVQHLVRYYTREAGVRQLQRDLRQMAQKVIRSLVGSKSSKPKSVPLDVAHVQKYLGRPRFLDEPKDLVLPPGVAVGLAYTSVGGDILYIESRLGVQGRRPEGSQGGSGVGRLLLTGSLGQVMQESAQTALSFIQSRHTLLGLAPELVEQSHIHMHLPDGATPKDGPSAGVAIMCALASLFLDKPLPHGLSMTGEITLRGQVLAIGGVKEKLLAAHRYGKRMIILPKANWNDLEDLPADVLADFELYPVEWMEDALRIARLIEAEVPVTPSVFVKLES
jgi:ATP-dependent Lon protease